MDTVMEYIHQYNDIKNQLPGNHLSWLKRFRQEKMVAFEESGFPSTRDEDWRYTSVKPITRQSFGVITKSLPDTVEIDDISGLDSYRMVFVDGKFSSEKSDLQDIESGVHVVPLSVLLTISPESVEQRFSQKQQQNSRGFTALNQALFTDGYVITITENTRLSKPLELVFVAHSGVAVQFLSNWIVAEAKSQACIVERHLSTHNDIGFTSSSTELVLHSQADVDFYLLQNQSSYAHHVSDIHSQLRQASRLSVYTMTIGGAIVRNNLNCVLAGEEAHCDMFGMFCLKGKQHVDNHTTVLHQVPHCSSNEYYRGVLDGRSGGVFHGRIKVAEDAQKTDAQQSNGALLLSDHVEMNSKPQLEIYADDVKCSHGATIGQLEPQSLFYLRSRGIDENQARSILTMAFVSKVINKIKIESLKAYVQNHILAQLHQGSL